MDNTQYTYKDSNLYNSRGDAVMMEWEREWMKISADIVCKNGGDVLNIGHGLGIVDSYIHENNPKSHWIIESHPDVHSHMKKNGWYDRANIIESRWQDVVNSLQSFDGIYFDTWGDSTDDFKNGLLNNLPYILNKGGIFSSWVNKDTESRTLNNFCKENNLNIQYEKLELNIPAEQHRRKSGVYINPNLEYVLLPIITNPNEVKKRPTKNLL